MSTDDFDWSTGAITPLPERIDIWDGQFNLQHPAVPVTEWEWSIGHDRARFTLSPNAVPIAGAEMLSRVITTDGPRQVWRVDQITTFIDNRCRVEIRDIQAELQEIQNYAYREHFA